MRALLLVFFGSTLFLTIRLAIGQSDNAENQARYDSTPDQLRAALSLNPRLSPAWIYLGLDAEAEGNLPEAETDLLQAARVDRQYLPAWTLTNFYFRRGDPAHFWTWAARAAMLALDYRPLLRLADALEPSPRVVVSRLAGGAPLLRAYLDVLIGEGRFNAAQQIAGLLTEQNDPADRARLADLADRIARVHDAVQ